MSNVTVRSGTSRRKNKHFDEEEISDSMRSWLMTCGIPVSVRNLTLKGRHDELLEFVKEAVLKKRTAEEGCLGVQLIRPENMHRNVFQKIFLVLARDCAVKTDNQLDRMPLLTSPDILEDDARRFNCTRYMRVLIEAGLGVYPKMLFLDGFYDVERCRDFYGTEQHRQAMIDLLMFSIRENIAPFMCSHGSLQQATNWYPQYVIDSIEDHTIKYRLE